VSYTFNEGDSVVIHSLGNLHLDKEYRAIIRGISVDYGVNPATIWIVELLDKPDPDYAFGHCTMPEACLRRSAEHFYGVLRARFEFEGHHHIYDFVEHCYWIRESQKEIWQEVKK
jgi:hypothetical protein